ncbi:MAG TPA: FAD-binding oxidoreductase [Ilumatobacteraceae bacterium]|nr:FAD-binding oxidoreductase [Ilumatobacteraceae bacterium]
MDETALRARSLWLDQLPGPLDVRAALSGDVDVDVAIVGGGYTGLWTAWALLRADPTMRVLVIERDLIGVGASGRNGGWCVGELAGGHAVGAAAMRAIIDTVDEVGKVVADEGIDCGFARGGVVRLARTQPQLDRQRHEVDEFRRLGFGDDVLRGLDATEASDRLAASSILGGLHFAPAARVQPARLARGLAVAVERRGGTIAEHTTAQRIDPATSSSRAAVLTDRGTVRADVVVRATEAYTRDLPGQRRTLAPLYSLMVATEPLPDDVWDDIGLRGMELFADDRRMVIYGQRTVDGRIAFGGRGAPYRYGSRIDVATENAAGVHDRIVATLHELLPATRTARITHRWGGVLGVPRDWRPSVGLDRAAGMAWAGGYVGEGVAAANLAGRTLADLITGVDSELTALAWVGHRSPAWEPEPLRWFGITAARRIAGLVDRQEQRHQRTPRLASVLDRIVR